MKQKWVLLILLLLMGILAFCLGVQEYNLSIGFPKPGVKELDRKFTLTFQEPVPLKELDRTILQLYPAERLTAEAQVENLPALLQNYGIQPCAFTTLHPAEDPLLSAQQQTEDVMILSEDLSEEEAEELIGQTVVLKGKAISIAAFSDYTQTIYSSGIILPEQLFSALEFPVHSMELVLQTPLSREESFDFQSRLSKSLSADVVYWGTNERYNPVEETKFWLKRMAWITAFSFLPLLCLVRNGFPRRTRFIPLLSLGCAALSAVLGMLLQGMVWWKTGIYSGNNPNFAKPDAEMWLKIIGVFLAFALLWGVLCAFMAKWKRRREATEK